MRRVVVLVAGGLLVPLAGAACSLAIPFGDYDADEDAETDASDAARADAVVAAEADADADAAAHASDAADAAADADADADAMNAYDGPAYAAVVEGDDPLVYLRMDDVPGSQAPTIGGSHIVVGATYGAGAQLGVPGALVHDPDTAVKVTGTSSAVDLTSDAIFTFPGTAPYTFEAWCLPDGDADKANPGAFHVFWSRNQPSGDAGRVAYAAGLIGTSFYAERLIDGDDGTANIGFGNAPTQQVPAVWSHVAVTFDGLNHDLYVDGVLQASKSWDAGLDFADPTVELLIGGQMADVSGDQATFFVGSLDELAVYDHALTATQIATHYAVGAGLPLPVVNDP